MYEGCSRRTISPRHVGRSCLGAVAVAFATQCPYKAYGLEARRRGNLLMEQPTTAGGMWLTVQLEMTVAVPNLLMLLKMVASLPSLLSLAPEEVVARLA